MLLRRITEHVKAQNWTAVALDFFIVVVGVFIGIQVANWNEDRSDRRREAHYLDNLSDDIREEIVVIEEVRDTLRVRNSVIEKLFEDSLGQTLPSEIKTSLRVSDVSAAGDFAMPEPINLDGLEPNYFLSYAIFARIFSEQNSTFETLQATGDFGLIRNRMLASGIADYYAGVENLRGLEGGTVRQVRDEAASIAKRHGLNPFGANDYELVLTAIREDGEFAASLRTLRNISATNYTLATFTLGEAMAIVDQLGKSE